jgi:lysophospholipid acyltransferase 1/2
MLTQEFADKFIGYKLAYMIPSMVSVQSNFFAGFKFEEAGLIACGFGYAETVKEDKVERIYDSVRAVRVRGVLTSTKSADTFQNWNIQIHNWLKYYVMIRVMDKTKPRTVYQPMPTVITFIVSLLWHGVMPGYFILFLGCAIIEV